MSEINPNSKMRMRILILSASAGNGHVRAAEALARATELTQPDCQVRHIDALTLVSPALRAVYSRAYIRMVNRAPSIVGWLYNHLDQPFKDEKRRLILNGISSLPLIREIIEYSPDLIICTHFLPADIVSILKESGRISAPHAVVITDLDAHGMWLARNVDHYFVGLEETRLHLISLGVAAAKISVTGIPIDPVFTGRMDTNEARKKLGLEPKPTVIISAGGFGVGKIEELIASLKTMKSINVLAMCGKNEALKRQIEAGADSNIKAVGYTEAMQEYMAAADIIVGKPGGLTSAEALSQGLIFVIVNPIPGQEERNASHLLEAGAALRANNLSTLGYKIERLLNTPRMMDDMKRNSLALARADAALCIMRIACSMTAFSGHIQPIVDANRQKRKKARAL